MMDRKRRAARRTRPLAPAAEVLELRQLLTTYTGQVTRDAAIIYAPTVAYGSDYTRGTFTFTMTPPSDNASFYLDISSSTPSAFVIYHDSAMVGSSFHGDVRSAEEKFTIVPVTPLGDGSVVVTAEITPVYNSGYPDAQPVVAGQNPISITIKGRTVADPGPSPDPRMDTPQAGNQGGSCCPKLQALSTDDPGKIVASTTKAAGGPNAFSGAVNIDPSALYSDGFGKAWGLTTDWTSVSAYSAGGSLGKGFVNLFQPTVHTTPDGVMIVSSATDVDWFDSDGTGGYVPKFFGQDTLVVAGSGGTSEYVLTDAQGNVARFYGPGASASLTGKFKSFTDPFGNQVTTTYNGAGQLTDEERTDGAVTETYEFTYLPSGVNAGLMSEATLKRSNVLVRSVDFTYYDGTAIGGNAGDLQLETIKDGSGAPIDASYFRYYTTDGGTGYADGMKYVFHEEAYARLTAAGAALGFNPLTAPDATIAPYADNYYEYDSDRRVVRTDVQGAGCSCGGSSGAGTYTYAYASSPFAGVADGDFNVWRSKTVETLPDGNQNVYYFNFAGEPILKAFYDVNDDADPSLAGKVWATSYRYDDAGRLIMTAQPSAVAIADFTQLTAAEANSDLVGFNASAGSYQYLAASTGVVNLYEYAAATTGGDVAGYLKADWIKNGYGGTAIQLDGFTYASHADANGATVHPLASSTVYGETDGTGARTTSYAYTWYGATNQVYSISVSLPVVGSSQNGPGSADVETTWYDSYGRPTWFKDADGFITYTGRDVGTGAVVETIVDVDTTRTGLVDLPAGLATPVGGGLHLISTYQVDGLGRTTREIDPTDRVTYWVYDDPAHEVRAYRGWNATTGTTTGPIEVVRYDPGRAFFETFTMAATPDKTGAAGSYVPTGAEAVSNLRSLSRTLYDKGGRVIEVDDYFDLDGMTYSATTPKLGTAGVNYYAATYGYDSRGRTSRIVDAVGTITSYKYDSLGRLSTTSVGTSDPYDGNPDSNMKVVAAYQYDGGGAVGDGNLTTSTAYPDGESTANDRVTRYAYDWRNRLVAVKGGVQSTEGTDVQRPLTYYELDNLGEVTSVSLYDGDGVAVSSSKPAEGSRRAYTEYAYDDQGRVYDQKTYSIDQATGAKTSTNYLSTSNYYDHRGYLIASRQPGGLASKAQYDGAGRIVDSASTDGAGGTTWAAAGSLAGDHVLTETRTQYNKAGDPILVTSLDRNHNAGAATGPLSHIGAAVPAADPGFEDAIVAPGSYVVNSGGVVAGSSWTFAGTSGVSANGSAFTSGNPNAPQGGEVAYLQFNGSVSQTITGWQAGTYTISFQAARRGNYGGAQTVQVKVDGVTAATFTASSTDYQTFSATFAVAAGGHTITFAGTSAADDTAFIDAVSIAATDARASYSAYYYDPAHRLLQAVDVGANGGAAYARPTTGPAPSDAVHVVGYYYDDAGRVAQTTDPRGLVTRYSYDALGRVVETVANATTSWPSPVGAATGSTNNTTRFTYDGLDHVRTVTAVMPSGGTNQTTTYNYGVTTASGSKIDSNGLLGSVVQPDSTAAVYAYNALGQAIKTTDAVGTTHEYAYDVVGRLVADAVATLGTGVDGAVRRIDTAYDTAGRASLFTDYDAASGGSIVDQVLDRFNGYGQLTAEFQGHSGAVDTSTTPSVQYAYTTPDASHNYSRLTFMAYPDGRVVGFAYDASGAGIDAAVGRLSSVVDYATAATLESYKYLGLDTIVERSQPEAKTKLTYIRQPGDALANGDGGDQYTGLDRFGRVIDQNWVRTSGSAGGAAAGTSTIRLQYGYDRDGNALFRHDLLFEALDDLYQYDGLNRLSSYKRGVLSSSTPGGPLDTVATPYGQQSWTLDAQGNWSGFADDATTTTRTFNAANETTSVSGGTAPAYDDAGNTTAKDGKSFVYDAWNRLVAVKSGATTLVSYAYDALRRRIKETKAAGATDVYFTPGGQIAEERFGTTTYQYVHGASGQIVLRDVYVSGALQPSWRLYAQQDSNGNVVALVGGSAGTAGDRQEWYWYEPYGAVHVLAGDGSWRSGSYHDWRSYFQGGRLDAATGLYVFGLRDYDPGSGVWMERDPIGLDAGDPNLYRFVGNNPVNWTDPTGLQAAFGGVAAPKPLGLQGSPVSINLTTPGRTPTVTVNPPKANQPGRTEPNTNPWLSRGGADRKTGETFYSTVSLEWVITFDGTPCKGQWGRTIWSDTFRGNNFRVNFDGSVRLTGPGDDDTDPPHDYVLGNSVYMYDAPGQIAGSPAFIFNVWAKSCDGKTRMSKWYYVNGGSGKMYEVPKPKYDPPNYWHMGYGRGGW